MTKIQFSEPAESIASRGTIYYLQGRMAPVRSPEAQKNASASAGAFFLVNLTTSQVETLFGEMEYIEPRLKALGVTLANEEADRA